jgi:hypothetical protein
MTISMTGPFCKHATPQKVSIGPACQWPLAARQQLAVLALKALMARGLGDTRHGAIARTRRHRDPLYGAKKLAKTTLAFHNRRA